MPRDFDAQSSAGWPGRGGPAVDWRLWVSSPARLAAVTAAVLLVGLGLGYVISALFFFPARNLAADLERVPDVVGEPAEEARASIESRDLVYREGATFYHEAAKGTVLAQEPLPGQMAQPGSEVAVTLSLGPRMGAVPDVVGLAHEQAELVLEGAGYSRELIWVDDATRRGQVVGTRPAPGTPIELSGEVKVLVSAGPPFVQVPELTSRTLTAVEESLDRLGLKLGDVTEEVGSAAPGTVIAQNPAAGTEVARGTEVAVTVVRGNVRGDSVPPSP